MLNAIGRKIVGVPTGLVHAASQRVTDTEPASDESKGDTVMQHHYRALLASAGAMMTLGAGVLSGSGAASAATVPHCANADLRVSLVNIQGAAGSRIGDLRLTNITRGWCWTRGYSGVSYVGYGNGTQIGRAATWDAGTIRTVTLGPGRSVNEPIRMVNVQNYSAATCHPVAVDGLRVYVPGSYLAKFVPYRTTGCRSTAVTTISVRPVGA